MQNRTGVIYLPRLCGNESIYDSFWSWELIVNTTTPDLTTCFQNTVLVWVPCAMLWLATPFYTLSIAKRLAYHSWTSCGKLYACKLIASIALVLLALIGLILKLTLTNNQSLTVADVLSSVIQIITFGLTTFYTCWLFRKGVHTSGLLFLFWLLFLLGDIIMARSQGLERQMPEPLVVTLYIQLAVVALQLLMSLISDTKALDMETALTEEKTPLLNESADTKPKTDDGERCPKESASILSLMFFSWFLRKFFLGVRRALTLSDLWRVMDQHSAEVNHAHFDEEWKKEWEGFEKSQDPNVQRPSQNGRIASSAKDVEILPKKERTGKVKPSLLWSMARTFLPYYALSSVFLCINITFSLLGPQILQAIIAFVEGDDPLQWKGYFLAVILALNVFGQSVSVQHSFFVTWQTTIRMRGALVSAIYRKALLLSNASRQEVSVGAIVSLVVVDLNMIYRSMMQLNYFWATPLVVTLCTVLLWQQIGASSLAALLLLAVLMPTNSIFLAKKLKKVQRRQMELKDQRLKLTSQILSGMKVLKLYAWESSFDKELREVRRREMVELRKSILLSAGTFAAWMASPFVMTLACLVTYTLSSPDHVLDAQKTFVSMSIINVMNWPLTAYSECIKAAIQGLVSINRLQKFLLSGELENPPRHTSTSAISIKEGSFTWDQDDMVCLRKVNLDVKQGELVAVVGTVGSGKSSLVSAFLGEMKSLAGSISLQGSVAYVPQSAWIQNLTLRDNILFSLPLNRKKYNQVLDACALRQDLQIIQGGDMAEIGEKGITLSGGQKQRVSLARAVYSDRDVYLLDDPLSAVDAHVGKELFDKVIGPNGMLKHKTRLLVTHGISYLPQVDRIVVMNGGSISEIGSYEELLEKNGAFAEFLRNYMTAEDDEDEDALSDPDGTGTLRRAHTRSSYKREQSSVTRTSLRDGDEVMQKLIDEETTSTGRVKFSVVRYYLKAARVYYPCLLMVSVLIYIVSQCLTQLWLSEWSQDQPVNGVQDEELVNIRLGVYGGLAALQILSVMGVTIAIAFGAVIASYNLHSGLLASVLRSPMSFFDTTPQGRILNRFSRDMDAIDQLIPVYTQIMLSSFVPLISIIFIVVYTIPIAAVVVLPLLLFFVFVQRSYIKCGCQLQRLDAICRSPVYAFLEESLTGGTCIRAYGYQKRFRERMDQLLNTSQGVWFEVIASQRFLNMTMSQIGNTMLAATALFGIANRNNMDPSTLGMAISFAMQVGMNLAISIRFLCELEVQIVSTERIKEYCELPSEAPLQIPSEEPSPHWPEEGRVVFQGYQARYRPGLELVLKGVDLQIKPSEKVGVVGRTGAGKSSLTVALFRLIEADSGVIQIDDRDISKMGLHDVRGRISIIPQDPVLFSGTLRFNLDPSGRHSDANVWKALRHAHLEPFVSSLPDGLQHVCDEGGGNLSVGQRQLVCLARALLRMSKILVLDEATAAVDMETDDLIQSTIRSQFKDCTVITIAHRLNTIMDYDRVLVMDAGRVLEFDSPTALVADSSSRFHAMAKDAHLR